MSSAPPATGRWANRHDRAVAGVYDAREADWRNGAVVYQVLVDRFAPSADLHAKRHLYPAPKRLRTWDELPEMGEYLPAHRLWSHEIDFWGGDLASLASRLDHIHGLGADVLYLNPIHGAYTNHKYDALDFEAVSPEFGSRADVVALASALHGRGMKLVLDGVFNHMGRNSAAFQQAQADTTSPFRAWFAFDDSLPGGARAWANAENLPELNLEHPAVRGHIFDSPDSVVRRYLREGVDGWRLDVAHDIGFTLLQDLTDAAHAEKPGSVVIGEAWNYPKEWFPSLDGIMNFTLREVVMRAAEGRLSGATAARMVERVVQDAGIEPMLKSWLMLDNHDTVRLATRLPDAAPRRLAQLLQFTLPGAPNLYYGSELGMTGGTDPEMRAPMRWDWAVDDNAELQWVKQLIGLRRDHRALRIGDFRRIETTRLLGFERHTDRVADTVLVLANPSALPVSETVLIANSKLMNVTSFTPLAGCPAATHPLVAGLMQVDLPAWGVMLLAPQTAPVDGYTSFKRVQ